MNLSTFSDYALRLLLLANARPNEMITIREAAETYDISQAHLKKVVTLLSNKGYLLTERGHGGGFTLNRPAQDIHLGALVRETEPGFALVECLHDPQACLVYPVCGLPRVFDEALTAFLAVLDRYTLQDIALSPASFLRRR